MEPLIESGKQWVAQWRQASALARWGLTLAVVLVGAAGLVFFGRAEGDALVPLMGGDVLSTDPLTAAQVTAMEAAFGKAQLNDARVVGRAISVPRSKRHLYLKALVDQKALPAQAYAFTERFLANDHPFSSSRQREEAAKLAKAQEVSLVLQKISGVEEASVLFEDTDLGGFPRRKTRKAVAAVRANGGKPLPAAMITAIRGTVQGTLGIQDQQSVTILDLNAGVTHVAATATAREGNSATQPHAIGAMTPPKSQRDAQPSSDRTASTRAIEGVELSSNRASQASSEVARASYAVPHSSPKRSATMERNVAESGEVSEGADGKSPAEFAPHVAAIPIAARGTDSVETPGVGDADTMALVPLDMTTALAAGDWDRGTDHLGDGASDTDSLWSSVAHPGASDANRSEDSVSGANAPPHRHTSSRRSGDRSRQTTESDSATPSTAESDAPVPAPATATHTTNFRLATATTAASHPESSHPEVLNTEASHTESSHTESSHTESSHTESSHTAAITASTSAPSTYSHAANPTTTAFPTATPKAAPTTDLPNRANQSANRAWSADNPRDLERDSVTASDRGSNDFSRQQRRMSTRMTTENPGIEGRSSSAFSRNEAASLRLNSATGPHNSATRPSVSTVGRPLTTLVGVWVRDNLLTLAGSAFGILLFVLLKRSLRVIRREDRAATRLRDAQSATTAAHGRIGNYATRSRRAATNGETSRRQELQEQIQADPSGAAAALKQWMGNAA
jgi:hypothetical protein